MALYDEEMIIKALKALMQAQLTTEITAVNTEKNDTITLAAIPNDAYIFEVLNRDAIKNYSGFFMLYAMVDNNIDEAAHGNAVESVTVSFEIGTFCSAEAIPDDLIYKLLRYRKALKNVVMKNLDVFQGYSHLKMASLKPNALPIDGNYAIIKAGVDITASLTAF